MKLAKIRRLIPQRVNDEWRVVEDFYAFEGGGSISRWELSRDDMLNIVEGGFVEVRVDKEGRVQVSTMQLDAEILESLKKQLARQGEL